MKTNEWKIIFWGTGSMAKNFCHIHRLHFENLNIIGFIDRNPENQGKDFYGYPIFLPSILIDKITDIDCIVILSSFYKEIRVEIRENYDIENLKIYNMDRFNSICLQEIYTKYDKNTLPFYDLIENIYDNETMGIESMFSYLYLKEHYSDYVRNLSDLMKKNHIPIYNDHIPEKTNVWICWFQGIEQAPDIVKCCIHSIQRNMIGIVHMITKENFQSYVSIESHIIEKWERGIISNTHFSDILRLALLTKYGGIWIDATCLIMKPRVPNELYQYPLFMYSLNITLEEGYNNPTLYSSWFIITNQKNNLCLTYMYKTLIEWWRYENTNPFFLFYHIQRLILELVGKQIPEIPMQYMIPSYHIQMNINKKFDKTYWNLIQKERSIQKLSYKIPLKNGNTYYQYIIDTYLK